MKVLTANRLIDGEAVWYSAEQTWSETIVGAEIANDKAAEEKLEAIGKAAFAANFALDIELIDVRACRRRDRPDTLARTNPCRRPDQPHRPRQAGPSRNRSCSMIPGRQAPQAGRQNVSLR